MNVSEFGVRARHAARGKSSAMGNTRAKAAVATMRSVSMQILAATPGFSIPSA